MSVNQVVTQVNQDQEVDQEKAQFLWRPLCGAQWWPAQQLFTRGELRVLAAFLRARMRIEQL